MKVKVLIQVIISFIRSSIKQIVVTERKTAKKEEGNELIAFPVPFALDELKEKITLNTNINLSNHTSPNNSKEEIVNQAIRLHKQGNIDKAKTYYKLIK